MTNDRAAERRATWSGGLVKAEDHESFDREFWARASYAERLAAVWEMAQQQWKREHPDGPPLRLDRTVGGLRKHRG